MQNVVFTTVLILVLVESGLGVSRVEYYAPDNTVVLILVLVESGLGVVTIDGKEHRLHSLNPCFSGKWSWR